jgi:hypothetical protein
MKIAEFKIVLNVRYGGFSLTKEMTDWLVKNKGWKVDKDGQLEVELYRNDEVRRNPDLIECVRAVQKAHADDSWSDRYYDQTFALRIFNVTVNLGIEDIHDGKEEAQVCTTIESEPEDED